MAAKSNFKLIFYLLLIFLLAGCQAKENINWQHLDLKDDGVFGISTDKAYKELLKGKKSVPVIVAIMDSGFDIEHEELKTSLWINEEEIAGNGIDDDNNGYIDDVHGWNLGGSAKGKKYNGTAVLTCLVVRDQKRFAGTTYATVLAEDRADFETYQKNKADLEKKRQEASDKLVQTQQLKTAMDTIVKQLKEKKPAQNFTLKDFQNYQPKNDQENRVRSFLNRQMKRKTFEETYQEDILDRIESYEDQLAFSYNVDYVPRSLDNDHANNLKGRFYGNGDVEGPEPDHGTHVAGIIGADRNNKLGVRGIADQAKLMLILFSTTRGDEGDRIAAQAIRYAVDHGAKVINMSWGNYYSWNKDIVDEAIKYAVSKDVLLIHAVGNDNKDMDKDPHFPNPYYLAGGKAETWINVGASDKDNDETLRASFSNYGKTQVDVFAPGVRINSTVPGSMYKRQDGTSMAAPIVTGLAALIRSYYPALTAIQVKEVIMKSVIKADQLKDRCVSGGIVNAYEALKLAENYASQ